MSGVYHMIKHFPTNDLLARVSWRIAWVWWGFLHACVEQGAYVVVETIPVLHLLFANAPAAILITSRNE